FASARLWGLVLNTLELQQNGRIVVAQVTRPMFEQVGLEEDGTEGLVETIRGIDGVDVAILLREEASGSIKASFRTTEAVDASVLALANGGGGHARAAGCTLPGPLSAARRRVLDQTVQLLEMGTLGA
ncbi:MAG TPA: DHHA1 domain-containing protein, partial [Chloroflexota bacterium]